MTRIVRRRAHLSPTGAAVPVVRFVYWNEDDTVSNIREIQIHRTASSKFSAATQHEFNLMLSAMAAGKRVTTQYMGMSE